MEEIRTSKYSCDFFQGYNPRKKKLNILFFGASSTGKSSTINNFLSPKKKLHRHAKSRAAVDDGKLGSLTQKFRRYPINDKISLFDCWGWNIGSNYKGNRLQELLIGKLKDGQKRIESWTNDQDESTTIDFIVFVLDHTVRSITKTHFKHFAEKMSMCDSLGLPFMVVVTKIDVFMEHERSFNIYQHSGSERIYDHISGDSKWESLVKYIQKSTGRFDLVVTPLVNEKATMKRRNMRCHFFCSQLAERIKEIEFEASTKCTTCIDLFQGERVIDVQFDKVSKANTSPECPIQYPSIIDLFYCPVVTINGEIHRLYWYFAKTTLVMLFKNITTNIV